VTYLKSAVDAKYYTPLVADIVGLIHVQGGILNSVGSDIRMLDHFQMGPNLVRGFAPNGIGPRDLNPFGTNDALGGTKYWGASAELQMPFWFLPKEVGLKGSVYADAGSLYDYKGPTSWAATNEINVAGCVPSTRNPVSAGTCTGLVFDNGNVVRTSVGVGLIWASPFGPLRFDYAVPLTKGANDRVQQFKFGGGDIVLSSIPGRTATGGMAQPAFFEQPPLSTLADIATLTKAHLADPSRGGNRSGGWLHWKKPARCTSHFSTT